MRKSLIQADVICPPELKEKFKNINFTYLFREQVITEEMLSSEMSKIAAHYHRKFPQPVKTLCYDGVGILLSSEMASFYLQIGYQIKNVVYAQVK